MATRLLLILILFSPISTFAMSNEKNWSCRNKIDKNYKKFLYKYNHNLDYAYDNSNPDRHRQKLDLFYHDKNPSRTPLVIFFHGGGFEKGDKCNIFSKYKNEIKDLLSNKIAVASVNYSFLVSEDGRGATRAFDDGDKAFRFLRYRAQWRQIDTSKIILAGNSAGAGIASSIGYNNTYSHNIVGLMLFEAQATYSIPELELVFEQDLDDLNRSLEQALRHSSKTRSVLWHLKKVYGVNNSHEMFDHRADDMDEKLGLLRQIDSNDPPIYVENVKQDDELTFTKSRLYHHRRNAEAIAYQANRRGVDVVVHAGEWARNNVDLAQERANFLTSVLNGN